MARKHNIFVRGKYPVYEALYEDGTIRRMSFATCAKKYAKGQIEFENGRRLMSGPETVLRGFRRVPNPAFKPIRAGRVWVSDSECVDDPMTEAKPVKRVTAAQVKKALRDLLDALENPDSNLDCALDVARKLAA